jgi:hypothetical protein
MHHASWLAAHTAAAEAMQSELDAVRSTISNRTTSQVTKAALQGSKLPKKVTIQQARQLLIDKQLLAHSLNSHGFAAARVAALQQYYKSIAGLSASAAAAGAAPDCITADGGRCQTSAADAATDQQQQQQQRDEGCNQDSTASRGILIVGGSRTHLGNAYILLKMLREHFKCQLSVEVVYYGPQVGDGPNPGYSVTCGICRAGVVVVLLSRAVLRLWLCHRQQDVWHRSCTKTGFSVITVTSNCRKLLAP